MKKFKGLSSMRQYMKMKPLKWALKWRFGCPSSTGQLCESDLYLGQKKDVKVNLGESAVM